MPRSRPGPTGGPPRRSSGRRGRIHPVASTLALGLVAALAAPAGSAVAAPGGAPPPIGERATEGASAAVGWLADGQREDGTLGSPVDPLLDTARAVRAIGEQAQTDADWSPRSALDAVDATRTAPLAPDPLDALDGLADGGLSTEEAVALLGDVAEPLSLSSEEFDPGGDGQAVDLVAAASAVQADDPLYLVARAVPALALAGATVPEDLSAAIVDGRVDGAWVDRDGEVDAVLTRDAVVALLATGTDPQDEVVTTAMTALAGAQRPDGAWGAGQAPDAHQTAAAVTALRAIGFDPGDTCWSDELGGPGEAEGTPVEALLALQAEDGHFGDGASATPTVDAVRALVGGWRPEGLTPERGCGGDGGWPLPVPASFLVLLAIGVAAVVGAVRIVGGDDAA